MESLNEECPICLSSLIDSDKYITQCCKKTFHHTCYIECMKIKTECPLCRAGQVVIFVNPISNTDNTDDISSLCCQSLRYWAKLVCGIFLCTSLIIAMNHYSPKN